MTPHKSPDRQKVAVQLTPIVTSGDRQHVLDETCWCEPKLLDGWWRGQDVVVHRPARNDGAGVGNGAV